MIKELLAWIYSRRRREAVSRVTRIITDAELKVFGITAIKNLADDLTKRCEEKYPDGNIEFSCRIIKKVGEPMSLLLIAVVED